MKNVPKKKILQVIIIICITIAFGILTAQLIDGKYYDEIQMRHAIISKELQEQSDDNKPYDKTKPWLVMHLGDLQNYELDETERTLDRLELKTKCIVIQTLKQVYPNSQFINLDKVNISTDKAFNKEIKSYIDTQSPILLITHEQNKRQIKPIFYEITKERSSTKLTYLPEILDIFTDINTDYNLFTDELTEDDITITLPNDKVIKGIHDETIKTINENLIKIQQAHIDSSNNVAILIMIFIFAILFEIIAAMPIGNKKKNKNVSDEEDDSWENWEYD